MRKIKLTKGLSLSPIKFFWGKLAHDDILLYAQGLTFNTLLTLIPLSGLIFSLGRSFLHEELILQRAFLFLSNYLTAEALISALERIIDLLENLRKLPLGRYSLLLYFFMSLGLLFQIEDILNKIFLAFKKRSIKERILFYWVALTLAPFLFLLPIFLQTSPNIPSKFQYLSYFAFLFVFFYLIYTYFPARRIGKKASLLGAFVTTFFWYLVTLGFGFYVKKAIVYSKLYGSLSIIPIFLLFLFVNWMIFLFGAEITYMIEKKPWKKGYLPLYSPFREFFLILYLSKTFYEGSLCSIRELEKNFPLANEDILKALETLEKRKFIYIKDEEIFFRTPPEKITLLQFFDLTSIQELRTYFPVLAEVFSEVCEIRELLLERNLKDFIKA